MNPDLFQRLLYCGESEQLDFKVDQYSFQTEDEKSDLLKDILAFANSWRNSDAHILMGVEEVRGGPAVPRGVTKRVFDDNNLQQFVKDKANKPISFRYEEFVYNGITCASITIPVQQRPFFAKRKFGKVEPNQVCIRRGSATDVANPDEVAAMAKPLASPYPSFLVIGHSSVQRPTIHLEVHLSLFLSNEGSATADQVQIIFDEEPRSNASFDHRIWNEKPVRHPFRGQIATGPLHRGEKELIGSWPIGMLIQPNFREPAAEVVKQWLTADAPLPYQGENIRIRFRVNARDQPPAKFLVEFSKEEICNRAGKTFEPLSSE